MVFLGGDQKNAENKFGLMIALNLEIHLNVPRCAYTREISNTITGITSAKMTTC